MEGLRGVTESQWQELQQSTVAALRALGGEAPRDLRRAACLPCAAAHEYRAAHGIDAPILPAPSDFVQSCSAPSIAGPCVHPRRSVYFDHKHLLWDSPAQAAYWRKA